MVVHSVETSVNFYLTTWCYIPEYTIFRSCRYESKSSKVCLDITFFSDDVSRSHIIRRRLTCVIRQECDHGGRVNRGLKSGAHGVLSTFASKG
jgi:hypothetical protein